MEPEKLPKKERMNSLVCKSCRLDGYLPKDTTDYPCELCGVKGCEQFQKVRRIQENTLYQKI